MSSSGSSLRLSQEDLDRKINDMSIKSVNSIGHDAAIVELNTLEETERESRMEKGRDPNIAYHMAVINKELHDRIPVVDAPTTREVATDMAISAVLNVKDAIIENAPVVAEQLRGASIATANAIAQEAPIVAEKVKEDAIYIANKVAENAPIVAEKMKEGTIYTANVVMDNAPIVAEKVKDASIYTAQVISENVKEASIATANAIVENAPIVAEKIQDAAISTTHTVIEGTPIMVEHMAEGGASLLSKLGEVAYNASASITGSIMGAVEPYAAPLISKLGDIEESVENTIVGYVNTGKVALGMKVESSESMSWKVVDRAEEMERSRRITSNDELDPEVVQTKAQVEQEILNTVSKPVN